MLRNKIAATLTLGTLIVGTMGSCAIPSATPTDVPCTQQGVYCRYFLLDGKPVRCEQSGNNVCSNAPGKFYVYITSTKKTMLCQSTCEEVSAPVDCTGSVTYEDLEDRGVAWKVVSREEAENATNSPISVTLTSTRSETVEVNTEVGFETKADVVLAAVRSEINASVSESVTTIIGIETTQVVPPGETGYAIYGVRMQVTEGQMRNVNGCTGANEDLGQVTTYVPISSGWCLWDSSSEEPCATID